MTQKSIAIALVLILSILALSAAVTPLAYAQTVIGPPRDIDPGVDTEQNIVCSGWSYTCG